MSYNIKFIWCLGVYLTDLVYLSMANPSCGLRENAAANNIFRILTMYQSESNYSHLPKDYPLKSQLLSVRYIDELLKFVEDDNFKKSLQLEPPSSNQSPQKFIPGHKKNSSWGNGYAYCSSLTMSDSGHANCLCWYLIQAFFGNSTDPSLQILIVDRSPPVRKVLEILLMTHFKRKLKK